MQRPVWAEMEEYLLAGADCLRKATKWSEVTNRGWLWSKYTGQVDQVPAVVVSVPMQLTAAGQT